jgi:hypothetical protein
MFPKNQILLCLVFVVVVVVVDVSPVQRLLLSAVLLKPAPAQHTLPPSCLGYASPQTYFAQVAKYQFWGNSYNPPS